jgi:hypothetical protein
VSVLRPPAGTGAAVCLVDEEELDSVSPDREYEYFITILSADLPRLMEVLGASVDADVLDVLETHWTGPPPTTSYI